MQIDLEQECLLIHKDEAMSVRIRVDVFVFFIINAAGQVDKGIFAFRLGLTSHYGMLRPRPALPCQLSRTGSPASVPCSLCLSKSLTIFF